MLRSLFSFQHICIDGFDTNRKMVLAAVALTSLLLPASFLLCAPQLSDVFGGLAVAAFAICIVSKIALDSVAGLHGIAHWQSIGHKPKTPTLIVQE